MTEFTGTVVARFRRHCLVENSSGDRVSCQIQRRVFKPVVGDDVAWRIEADDTGTVTGIHVRRSELTRVDSRGRPEIVAANLSELVVVLAPDPTPDWFLLDRYLAAAELQGFEASIVFNKIERAPETPEQLATYAALGYPTFEASAKRGDGLAELIHAMRDKRCALIGQSGVGKSSLLNAMLGAQRQAVGALSEKSNQGRHTTSTAVLHKVPGGGELIDSPGVRNSAPHIADPRDVAGGFRELKTRADACGFRNCRHLGEPGCAVRAAVDAGEIAAARYASYVRLHELTARLQDELR